MKSSDDAKLKFVEDVAGIHNCEVQLASGQVQVLTIIEASNGYSTYVSGEPTGRSFKSLDRAIASLSHDVRDRISRPPAPPFRNQEARPLVGAATANESVGSRTARVVVLGLVVSVGLTVLFYQRHFAAFELQEAATSVGREMAETPVRIRHEQTKAVSQPAPARNLTKAEAEPVAKPAMKPMTLRELIGEQ